MAKPCFENLACHRAKTNKIFIQLIISGLNRGIFSKGRLEIEILSRKTLLQLFFQQWVLTNKSFLWNFQKETAVESFT